MTRFWPEGMPVTVIADALIAPRVVLFESQAHPVERVLRRWRVDQSWWRDRVCREYFLVRTQTGLLIMLYRDVLTRCWRLQRVYD
jgi:hypothetical protein